MLSGLIALLGAFFFGLGMVLVRKGLVESNFFSATVVVALIGTIISCVLFLTLAPLNSLNAIGILFFILAGFVAPGFARLTLFKGVEKLGASMNASIFAAHPLFSSLIAVFMLSEHPSLGIWLGIICIICGGIIIERNMYNTYVKSAFPRRAELAFPVLSGLSVGFGYVLRKMGLNIYNEPIAGVAFTYLSSMCLYIILLAFSTNMRRTFLKSRQSLKVFWKAGLIICLGHLCLLYALNYGDVSLVAPLMNMEPFFVFIFSYMLIRELEKITYKLVMGALIIFTGVLLITVF